jgi:hypothetical protein
MKTITCVVLPLLSIALLAGCGDKPAETSSSSAPAAAEKSATEGMNAAESSSGEGIASEMKAQTAEVVAKVQEEAKAAYANLSQQLMESTEGKTDEVLKNIGGDLETRVQKFNESIEGDQSLTDKLSGAVKSLLGSNDGEAVSEFGELSSAKLTPEQTTLAKEVYNAAAALVTQRNFSSLEGMESDVGQLANAVLDGNYSQALPPLQKIYSQATLTPDQKNLLGKMYDNYMPADWKDSAAELQQGFDALKTKVGQ